METIRDYSARTGWRVLVALALVASLISSTGCTRWERIDVASLQSSDEDLAGKKVRVETDRETVDVLVSEVDYPWLIGTDYKNGFAPEVRMDLNTVTRLDIEHPEAELGNWLLVAGGVVLVAGIVVAIVAASSGNDSWSLFNL